MDSRKVLDYGDVLLRQADVDLLKGPHWLNDQVIACAGLFLPQQRARPLGGSDASPYSQHHDGELARFM